MSVEIIHSEEAPAAIGPYSQAMALGNLVFTSGQIPLLANGEFLEAEVASQTHQVCKNLDAVLKAAGSSLSSVIKTTVFLSDMAYFADFNEVYAQYFSHKPARSTVAVKALPKGAKVEIECIAVRA